MPRKRTDRRTGPPRGAGRSHFPAATANAKKKSCDCDGGLGKLSVCVHAAGSSVGVAPLPHSSALLLHSTGVVAPATAHRITDTSPGHSLTALSPHNKHKTPLPPAGLPKHTRRLPASRQQERRSVAVVKRIHTARSLRSSEPARPIASSAR